MNAAIDAIMQRDGCSPTDALARLAEIGLASLADAKNPTRSYAVTNAPPSSSTSTPRGYRPFS